MPFRSFSEINVFKSENWNATNTAMDAAKIMQKLNSEAQPAPWISGLTVSIQRRMPGTRILWNGIPLVGRENHLLRAGVWRHLVSYSNLFELIIVRNQLERIPRFLQYKTCPTLSPKNCLDSCFATILESLPCSLGFHHSLGERAFMRPSELGQMFEPDHRASGHHQRQQQNDPELNITQDIHRDPRRRILTARQLNEIVNEDEQKVRPDIENERRPDQQLRPTRRYVHRNNRDQKYLRCVHKNR